jgi:glucosylceramidase
MKQTATITLAFLALATAAIAQTILPKVHYISFDEPVTGNPLKEYAQDASIQPSKESIKIISKIKMQTFSGIGGCFNEIGGEALFSVPVAKQQEVLRNLFDLEQGCGFSFCRTAVGSSDFGIDAYSYSETPYDYEQKYFSIARDERFVLPYIKRALAFNPSLKVFASPWSPPGWMKNSGKMTGGTSNTTLKDSAKIYRAYALYFAKYIKEYAKHGVDVVRINPQNETDMNPAYPGCLVPPEQMAKFILDYLQPELKRQKIKTEVWAGTYRVAGKYEAIEVFAADPRMRKQVHGIGIQYTTPLYIDNFTQLYPEIGKMHTESSCHGGENSVEQAKKRWDEISNYLLYGVENFAYWNMILNETGKSGWNWRQNALITIDRQTGEVIYNPDYAVMYLVSKHIRPGDRRTAHYHGGGTSPSLVVSNDEGKYKVITMNGTNAERVINIEIDGVKVATVKIPANALSAITF